MTDRMTDRDIKAWMKRVNADLAELKRGRIRRPGGGGGVPDPLSVQNLSVSDQTDLNHVDMISGSIGGSPLLHESHNMRRFATLTELRAWNIAYGTLAYCIENRSIYMSLSNTRWMRVHPFNEIPYPNYTPDIIDPPKGMRVKTTTGIELIYDGTQWQNWTSNWAPLTLASGITVHQSYTPRMRVYEGMFLLEGAVTRSGGFTTSYVDIMPAGAIPDFPHLRDGWRSVRTVPSAGDQPAGRMFIHENGSVRVATTGGTATYYTINSQYPLEYL